MDKEIISLLFNTETFKVAPENEPFWYSSGKLGPYLINTKNLFENEKESDELLNKIDEIINNNSKDEIPFLLCDEIMNQYDNNTSFQKIIDKIIDYINNKFQINLIDYISGGEKLDWIFSIPVANLLGKPHISIFKDSTVLASTSDFEESTKIEHLEGKRIFHISDILETSSNFEKYWVPSINKLGSKINWSLFILETNENSWKKLFNIGIQPYALIKISEIFFNDANEMGKINISQFKFLNKYYKDPEGTMREFVYEHPDFIENSINSSDNEISKRAKLCKENNLYGSPLGDE